MKDYSDVELRDSVSRRDAQQVAATEVRYTDPHAWADALKADDSLGAVQDGIVWLSRVTLPANLDQVAGRPTPGGSRETRTHLACYVHAAYLARGQLQVLSCYCGVAPKPTYGGEAGRGRAVETAERVLTAERVVQVCLSRMPHLTVRTGGAVHLHAAEAPWQAHEDEVIESAAELRCLVCDQPVYFSNGWRHEATKRTEAYVEVPCPTCDGAGELKGRRCRSCHGQRVVQQYDHDAEPRAGGVGQ